LGLIAVFENSLRIDERQGTYEHIGYPKGLRSR